MQEFKGLIKVLFICTFVLILVSGFTLTAAPTVALWALGAAFVSNVLAYAAVVIRSVIELVERA